MRELNIRYILRNTWNDEILTRVVPLAKCNHYVLHGPDIEAYEVLVRDLGSGLKDKNGVEIFEGDIIRLWNGNKSFISNDGFQFTIGQSERRLERHELETMTIVGNIHENPELLEQAQ